MTTEFGKMDNGRRIEIEVVSYHNLSSPEHVNGTYRTVWIETAAGSGSYITLAAEKILKDGE